LTTGHDLKGSGCPAHLLHVFVLLSFIAFSISGVDFRPMTHEFGYVYAVSQRPQKGGHGAEQIGCEGESLRLNKARRISNSREKECVLATLPLQFDSLGDGVRQLMVMGIANQRYVHVRSWRRKHVGNIHFFGAGPSCSEYA